MELKDTVDMMVSNDYEERFKAEYYQLKIRYEKLKSMVVKYQAGTLEFKPECPFEILREQERAMRKYLFIMDVRAEKEKIVV